MGACYSKKASGGNRSYSTVHMASTKLDEASRLARPTPYARNQNANVDFAAKKGIPMSTKYSSLNSMDHGDIKNLKNTFQSNIPRFSSSLPVATAVTSNPKTPVPDCNENEALHVVNNNTVVNSHSASNISNVLSTPVNKLTPQAESQIKPKSIGSKSCPDKIVSQELGEERIARTPGKGTGLPRQFIGKSSHSISHINTEILAVPKSQQSKEPRNASGKNSVTPSPLLKSPSTKGFESRDSLSDFDSGLGNSLTDKTRPEDSDTVKDLEQLELQEDSSPTNGVDACPVRLASTPKGSVAQSKIGVKAPTYRREANGKWSFDEKHFGPETERTVEPKPFDTSGDKSPREKHSFKMNASENIFSTYASYKGLLSYQKKSFKPLDTSTASPRDKTSLCEKSCRPGPQNSPNISCIPKIKKPANQPLNRSSVFYCHNENEKSEPEKSCFKTDERSPEKRSYDSKQSSLDSDEKSDSTENGVLSPTSEVENREFLIDDEISDQPGLTFGDPKSEDSDLQSLAMAVTELHALQLASSSKKRTDSISSYSSRKSRGVDHRDSLLLGSDLGSSCSSIASDDLMLDYEKTFDGFPEGTVNEGPASPMKKLPETEADKIAPLRTENKFDFEEKNRKRILRRSSGPFTNNDKLEWRQRTVSLPLRPPRQMSVCEADDGSLKLDSSSYRLLCQDLNGVKTLLLRLKSVIQEAETINPFDQANPKNIFYHSLVHNDFPSSFITLPSDTCEEKKVDISTITQENADLRRQLVLLQQQLEEKDHTIHLLQQQMTKYLNYQVGCNRNAPSVNAATQTERGRSLTGSLSSSSSSADDSIETLVSVQDVFEKSFRKNSEEQDLLTEHLKEVARLLDNGSAPFQSTQSEC